MISMNNGLNDFRYWREHHAGLLLEAAMEPIEQTEETSS
jgi:hypothetical protein